MKCCKQYGYCWLGRHCPHRVAKIGQCIPKYPHPLRFPRSRTRLRTAAKVVLAWVICGVLVGVVLIIARLAHA